MINTYLNNALTPGIYFLIAIFVFLFTQYSLYRKYGFIWIEHILLSLICGVVWILVIPLFIGWKISEKMDKYLF